MNKIRKDKQKEIFNSSRLQKNGMGVEGLVGPGRK